VELYCDDSPLLSQGPPGGPGIVVQLAGSYRQSELNEFNLMLRAIGIIVIAILFLAATNGTLERSPQRTQKRQKKRE
jgi:hypothetical protein